MKKSINGVRWHISRQDHWKFQKRPVRRFLHYEQSLNCKENTKIFELAILSNSIFLAQIQQNDKNFESNQHDIYFGFR